MLPFTVLWCWVGWVGYGSTRDGRRGDFVGQSDTKNAPPPDPLPERDLRLPLSAFPLQVFKNRTALSKQNETKTTLSPIIILEACKHIARAHAAVRKWLRREPNGPDRDWEAASSAVRLRMFSGKERPARYSL